jgi:hypothetical protein
MKDENFGAAAFFHYLADYARFRLWTSNLAFRTGDRQHIVELNLALGASPELLHTDYIAGRHPVLLTAGADDRVHTFASEKSLSAHTGAGSRPNNF